MVIKLLNELGKTLIISFKQEMEYSIFSWDGENQAYFLSHILSLPLAFVINPNLYREKKIRSDHNSALFLPSTSFSNN